MAVWTSPATTNELPFVSVALITFNKKSTIEQCLKSLFSLDYPKSKYEVVVVDGGSTDGTFEIMRDFPVSLIIETRKCRGLARNAAVKNSRGDVIAFIDADCLASKTWLRDHVTAHRDPRVVAVGGSVLQGGDFSMPTRIFHETYFAAQSPTLRRRVTWDLATCNASFKRNTFRDVGLFPEIDRGEDTLLCWEALRKGYQVVYDPSPRVIHIHDRITFGSLLKRSMEQGEADREIQGAFGNESPFKLPRKFLPAALLTPSLAIARFVRYFSHLYRSPERQLFLLQLPVLIANSLLWTLGYLKRAAYHSGAVNG
jgi:glycosyltransferase involved in cell wall biosynthesis